MHGDGVAQGPASFGVRHAQPDSVPKSKNRVAPRKKSAAMTLENTLFIVLCGIVAPS